MVADVIMPRGEKTRYRVSVRGVIMLLEKAALVGILQRGQVFPLPWFPANISGLIETEFGVLPLVSTGTYSQQNKEGAVSHLTGVVQTRKGLIAIDIDAIDEASEGEAQPGLCLVEHLDEMADQLTSAQTGQPDTAKSGVSRRVSFQTFAHVRSGAAHIAIPAQDIARLERHQGIYPVSSSQSNEWIAQIGNEVYPASSLGHEALADNVSPEPWCILFADHVRPGGLLVEEVIELIKVDTSRIKTVQGVNGHSVWLVRLEQPPLRVLVKAALPDTGRPLAGAVSIETHGEDTQALNLNAKEDAFVGLQIGSHRLALPVSLVDQIIGRPNAGLMRETRRPNHLPVVDLGKVFNQHADTRSAFALSLKVGTLKFAVLVDRVSILRRNTCRQGCPALPEAIASLVQDIAVVNGELELGLKERINRRQLKSIFNSMPKDAFAGWLPEVH